MTRIAVLTSGGDAPGMNAAIRAVVRAAVYHGVETVGVRNGFDGIFAKQFEMLGSRSVSNIMQHGGTFLGTGRSERFRTPEGRAEAASILREQGIEALVVIGGNGSYAGAEILHRETGMNVVGIPGSIDNDVGGSDFSIGFDTAVNTALDAIDRIRDTAFSLARVFFVEVMGRHSGQIAAEVGIAGGAEAVIVPEYETDVAALACLIDEGFDAGKEAAIIVVAEGDQTGGATALAAQIRKVAKHTLNERVVILGYTQRGGAPTAADRLLASRLGVRAVQAIVDGERCCSVGIVCGGEVVMPLAEANKKAPVLQADVAKLARVLAGVPEPAL